MAAPYGTSFDFGGTVSGNASGFDTGTRVLDMQPGITLLAPTKTPLLSMLNKDNPRLESSTPNWLNDALDAVSDDPIAEGADYVFTDPSVSTRTQNVCRTFEKTAKVTTITEAEGHYDGGSNKTSERSHQLKLKFLAYKRNIEWALLNSTISHTSEATASTNRGILEAISDAGNSTTVSAPLTETNFKENGLKPIYDAGVEPTDVFATYVQHAVIDGFTASATKFIDANQKEVIDYINVYDSLLGRVNLHLVRDQYLADETVFAFDRSFWEWRWLIPSHSMPVNTTGHYWANVITGTGTLIHRNGSSGASLLDLDT